MRSTFTWMLVSVILLSTGCGSRGSSEPEPRLELSSTELQFPAESTAQSVVVYNPGAASVRLTVFPINSWIRVDTEEEREQHSLGPHSSMELEIAVDGDEWRAEGGRGEVVLATQHGLYTITVTVAEELPSTEPAPMNLVDGSQWQR